MGGLDLNLPSSASAQIAQGQAERMNENKDVLASFSRPVEIVQRLKMAPVERLSNVSMNLDGTFDSLLGLLEKSPNEVPNANKVAILKVISEVEGENINPDLKTNIEKLTLYYSTEQLPGTNTEQSAEFDKKFIEITSAVQRVEKSMEAVDGTGGISNATDSVKNYIGGISGKGLSVLSKLSPAAKTGVFLLIGLGLFKVANSPKWRRFLFGGAVLGGSLFLANNISKAVNNRSLDQNADRLMRGDKFLPLANYLNANYEEAEEKAAVNALVQAQESDNPFGKHSFAGLVNAANSVNFAPSLLRGIEFEGVDKEKTPAVAQKAIKLVIAKFGPDSPLHKSNKNIAEYWGKLMRSEISLKEALPHLIALDPTSTATLIKPPEKKDEKEKETERSFLGSLVAETGGAISRQFGSTFNNAKEAVAGFFNGIAIDSIAGNWLNRDIENIEDLGPYLGEPTASFAFEAAKAKDNIYTDASGITYGSYKVNMNEADFANPTKRKEAISTSIVKFYQGMAANKEQGYDNRFKGEFNLLAGAKIKKDKAGDYVVMMKYTPTFVPDNLTPFASILKLKSGNENELDHYSSNYAMAYFQAKDWAQLKIILSKADELKLGGDKLYTAETRTEVLEKLNLSNQFDPKKAQYLEEMIKECTRLAAGNALKEKGLHGFIAFAARLGTDGNAGKKFLTAHGITAKYGTPEFISAFRDFAGKN